MKKINSFAKSGYPNFFRMFLNLKPAARVSNSFKIAALLLAVVFSSTKSFSADGDPFANHTKRQYTVTQWGHTAWGLEYLPDDFYTTTQKYPILVFFHGLGETGSSEGSLGKLLYNGPSNFIAYSNYNMQFVNPNTGQTQKFIYIALQDPYWSPDVNQVWYVLKNNPRLKDRISNVFYTGLSAGGQQTMNAVVTNQEMANGITGIVPMSAAAWDHSGIAFARNSPVKAWCFHGITDNVCGYTTTTQFNDSLGPAKSRWTNLPPVHGLWNNIYTKDYRELIDGRLVNIYEWMLSCIGPNQAPVANAGPDQTFGVPTPATTLLGNGLDPDGLVMSYSWVKLSGPDQYTILNVANAVTALTNLTTGTYVFELTVTDNLGAAGKDTVVVMENISPIPVKLSEFNVRENSGNNLLQWKTSNEINSDYFSIERSSNARLFESIGRVNASGNSSTDKNYSFTDLAPLKGVNYYRLSMVDKDGKSEYSRIVSTSSKAAQSIEIVNSSLSYGKSSVNVMISSKQAQTANLAVIDAGGKVVLHTTITLQKGINVIEKNVGSLTKGIYYIKLLAGEESVIRNVASVN